MSVPQGKRGVAQLDALMESLNLVQYTLQILSNEKIFLPKYHEALANDIIHDTKEFYCKAWSANNIRVETNNNSDENKRNWLRRNELQKDAILICNNLLPLIQIAHKVYHLPTKRVKYWAGRVIAVRDLLKSWHNADVKRYRTIL